LFVSVDEKRVTLLLAALFLILVGSRAALIGYAGRPTPFMDEWDGDAAFLLQPYLQGSLTIGDLLAPFNEHRIVFSRLLVLSLLGVSGYWDVVLQMIVNAILDAATVVGISYALSRVLDGGWAIAAMTASVLINAVPYGYDNVLLGFNTHFYALLTFSFASLFLLADSRAWSWRWTAGILCAVASFFCMASGALTLLAAIAGLLLQVASGRRRGLGEWLGIAALAALFLAMVYMVPHVPDSDAFKARSLGEFLSALLKLASWPANSGLGLVLFLPSALFGLRAWVDRPDLKDPRWFNVMALGWVLAQLLALALGRAQWPLQSRYFDALLVGVTVNLVSALWLFQSKAAGGGRRIWSSAALAAWLSFLALSLTHPQRHLWSLIDERRQIAETEGRNVQSYLATGDAAFLAGAPALDIPYFKSDRLRELLDSPQIRSVLPPALLSRDPPRPGVEAAKSGFLGLSFVWLGSGVLLLFAAVASAARAPVRRRACGKNADDFA
jgi:hypothetical protein